MWQCYHLEINLYEMFIPWAKFEDHLQGRFKSDVSFALGYVAMLLGDGFPMIRISVVVSKRR
jgi:hypothetical protein